MRSSRHIAACVALILLFCPVLLASQPCPELPVITVETSAIAAAPQPDGTWTVVTLNMAEETALETVMRDLEKAGRIFDADVFLLQEILHSVREEDSFPLRLARRLRFNAAFAPGDTLPGGFARGVAVLTRFALRDPQSRRLARFDLGFKQRCRVALGVTIESPSGPVRVVNTHLDSRINSGERLKQLIPVIDLVSTRSGPQLVGGDFNTANVYWVRRWLPLPFAALQSRAVHDFMESNGFSTPFTSTGRTFSYLPLKLDWVFVKGLQALDAGVTPIGFSDHRGLWVTFPAKRADVGRRTSTRLTRPACC